MDLRVFTEQMFMREKRTRKPDFVWLPAAFLFKKSGRLRNKILLFRHIQVF